MSAKKHQIMNQDMSGRLEYFVRKEYGMRRNGEFVICQIAEEYMLIPTGNEAMRFHHVIIVSEVGAFLWQLLETEQTEESLLKHMMHTYEVDEKTARNDIADFVKRLKDGPIIGDDEYVLYRRK